MVQIAYAKGHPNLPFFFNLSTPVGRGYRNARPDDVALVQLCFVSLAQRPSAPANPAWSKVRVTGQTDDATLAAIDEWQVNRRAKFGGAFEADGIVSVVRTENGLYAANTPYDIVQLNLGLLVGMPSVWPRIDKDPRCNAVLGAAVRQALSGFLTP
jgi:hypothetical protein